MTKNIIPLTALLLPMAAVASTVELQLGYVIDNVNVASTENPIIVVEYNDSEFTDINETFCVDKMTTNYTPVNLNTEKYYSFQYNGTVDRGCSNESSESINGTSKNGEYAYIEFLNDDAIISTHSDNISLQDYMAIDEIEINKEIVDGTPLTVTEEEQMITVPLSPVDNKLYIFTSYSADH